jgi:hypothetical protein
MEQQLINEIKHCDMMIKFHTENSKLFQEKKQLFIDIQLLIQPEPEPPLRESRPFLDYNGEPHLFLDDDGDTIMSREGSCDDDDSIISTTSNAEDCLLEEIDNLKQEFYDFKTRMDKAIAKIDKGFDFIMGGCRASI